MYVAVMIVSTVPPLIDARKLMFPCLIVRFIMIPTGLWVIIGLFVGGFCISIVTIVRKQRAGKKYRSVGGANDRSVQAIENMGMSYQHAANYALPTDQKVVTYLVVDGRLIDKK